MDKNIKNRVLKETNYILATKETVRNMAKIFNVSKSTVHKDLHIRLKQINIKLFNEVDKILKYHIDIRHIRGGASTKKKYAKINTFK